MTPGMTSQQHDIHDERKAMVALCNRVIREAREIKEWLLSLDDAALEKKPAERGPGGA